MKLIRPEATVALYLLHGGRILGLNKLSYFFVMTVFLIKAAMKMNGNIKSNL